MNELKPLRTNRMIKRTIFLISALLFTSTSLNAQTVIGKYAGEFLALGVGGRGLAMGGAQVAAVSDITSAYWNPAGLAKMNYPQISLMHEEHFGDLVNYNYGAVAIPYGEDMSFGLSVIRLGVDGIPDTREALIDGNTGSVIYDINIPSARLDPSLIKEFSNTDWAFYGTFAKKVSDDFYWGANIKVIARNIEEYSATGIGFDVGAIYRATEQLTLGASLQDATTTLVAWSTGRNELITPTLKIGGAYAVEFLAGTFMPAVDFDVRFENRRYASNFHLGPVSFDMHLGLEYNYQNLFAVRAGYNDVKQFTVGAGVRLPKLNIDYSFARFNESQIERLPDSHRISLILTLEEPKFLRDGM